MSFVSIVKYLFGCSRRCVPPAVEISKETKVELAQAVGDLRRAKHGHDNVVNRITSSALEVSATPKYQNGAKLNGAADH